MHVIKGITQLQCLPHPIFSKKMETLETLRDTSPVSFLNIFEKDIWDIGDIAEHSEVIKHYLSLSLTAHTAVKVSCIEPEITSS